MTRTKWQLEKSGLGLEGPKCPPPDGASCSRRSRGGPRIRSSPSRVVRRGVRYPPSRKERPARLALWYSFSPFLKWIFFKPRAFFPGKFFPGIFGGQGNFSQKKIASRGNRTTGRHFERKTRARGLRIAFSAKNGLGRVFLCQKCAQNSFLTTLSATTEPGDSKNSFKMSLRIQITWEIDF